jgi:hypothetical protein
VELRSNASVIMTVYCEVEVLCYSDGVVWSGGVVVVLQ